MECLFCNDLEPNYQPEPGKDFICSQCVQLLLSADQKAKAIESFLEPEDINVRKTKVSKRNMVRKGHMRTIRPARN
jgi:hypothetical protein